MSNDIRLSTGFFTHHKTIKLERRLGLSGVKALIALWMWTANNRPTGILVGMSEEDIEIACLWDGAPDIFVATLTELHWLDFADGGFSVHGWEENQPWIIGADARKEKARKANAARWGGKGEMPQASPEDATRNPRIPSPPIPTQEYIPSTPSEPREHTRKPKEPKPQEPKAERPNACPQDQWDKYVSFSRKFHEAKHQELGAMADVTEKKILDGARALDNLVRVRGIDSATVQSVIMWSMEDGFWRTNLRALTALTNRSSNGDTKFANILASMHRELGRG